MRKWKRLKGHVCWCMCVCSVSPTHMHLNVISACRTNIHRLYLCDLSSINIWFMCCTWSLSLKILLSEVWPDIYLYKHLYEFNPKCHVVTYVSDNLQMLIEWRDHKAFWTRPPIIRSEDDCLKYKSGNKCTLGREIKIITFTLEYWYLHNYVLVGRSVQD